MSNRTSFSVPGDVGDQLREVREASTADTNEEFFRALLGEDEDIEVQLEDLETVELERSEKAKETRALAVGVLEAMDEVGVKEDLLDIIEELRKQEMVETNKEIVQYLIGKAQKGKSLNETDQALIDMVVEIETARNQGAGAAAKIAEGLFGETQEETSETTTTETATQSKSAGITTSTGIVKEPTDSEGPSDGAGDIIDDIGPSAPEDDDE